MTRRPKETPGKSVGITKDGRLYEPRSNVEVLDEAAIEATRSESYASLGKVIRWVKDQRTMSDMTAQDELLKALEKMLELGRADITQSEARFALTRVDDFRQLAKERQSRLDIDKELRISQLEQELRNFAG